jgi:hypothetical protein
MAWMLTRKVRSHSSGRISSIDSCTACIAALLTRMSMPPSSSAARAAISSQWWGSSMVPGTAIPRRPAPRTSRTVSAASSCSLR